MGLTQQLTLQQSTRPAPAPATVVTGKVTVVMPTYNEAENLPGIVAELLALEIDDLEIIIVDDNSPDGTGEVADQLAARYPEQIHVIHRPGKQGLGSAYREGFHLALKNGAGYIVQMDADFSHSPAYLPEMLEKVQTECDVVVGSRYVPGGAVDPRWRLWRRFLSRFGNAYARTIIGLRIRDATSGFRVFRRAVLESIDLSRIMSEGYSFQIEIAYVCQQAGFRMCEVPIFFEDRVVGRSKMDLSIVLEAIWRVWQMRLRHK